MIARAKSGDHLAFAALIRPHEQLALRMSYLITRDAGEAEEAVQEALVSAYFALRRFRRGSPFRPWLLRIVVNEAKDRRRSSRRRSQARLELTSPRTTDSAEFEALQSEQLRQVLTALNELREEERLVVACRVILGLSEEETSATLGTATGTTKSRYFRGRQHLRQQLEGCDA